MGKWNPQFEISLLDLLDDSYSSEKTKNALREFVGTYSFKKLFGNRVVDTIVNRTREENVSKSGGSLGSYSKDYRDSLVFSIYKGNQKEVDLTLTGSMLESINAKLGAKYSIVIQLEGEENRGKAQGHISGKLGKFGRAQKRDFLGLPKGELQNIFKASMRDFRAGSIAEVFV